MRKDDATCEQIHASFRLDRGEFFNTHSDCEPIAIIGIGCRFPGGVKNPEEFWDLLKNGKDAITRIPEDRWSIAEFYHPEPGIPGMSCSKWGGFLEDIDKFEPECFGISPREAINIDPQHRLLLETSWEAMEDAGLVIDRLAGSNTGVFVGISTSDYQRLQFGPENRRKINAHMGTGSAFSVAANRISYCFDFNGPSMAVDTACSSSLFSTHLACMNIWKGECDMALSGGVNVIITPETFIGFSQMSMLSPDGRCKSFDNKANGFVRSEGVGVVVLKPLSQALADKDRIYALIQASGVNQAGRTSGITVPSKKAQMKLLGSVYSNNDISPSEISYIEAHGTGTIVGDPIEANAIGEILSRNRNSPCYIGSVKSNIGHLEAAAGIAGLMKTALMLKNRAIVPSLHFNEPNPEIDFFSLKLKVPTSYEPMADDNGFLFAGVNSFGFGGANAHIVMSSGPLKIKKNAGAAYVEHQDPYLLVFSARSRKALDIMAQSYKNMLNDDHPDHTIPLGDICYTASMRRTFLDYRLSLTGYSKKEISEKIETFLDGGAVQGLHVNRRLFSEDMKTVFVFSGQGPQWWAMGRQLLEKEPIFARIIEKCDEFIKEHGDWSLLEELSKNENESNINKTAITQPALFSLQAGLFELLKSYGIRPDAVIGHSIGEVAAAYATGVYSLRDAVKIIFYRGSSMDRASSRGKMLAVALHLKEALRNIVELKDKVSVAAVNSPSMVTLSGDSDALDKLASMFDEQEIFHRFLRVDYAFHSHKMDPVKEDLLKNLEGLHPGQIKVPMISTVTGDQIQGHELGREYWWQNIRSSVRFADGIDKLIKDKYNIYVEISPHPVLANSIRECMTNQNQKNGFIQKTLQRETDEPTSILNAVGALHTIGYPVDFSILWPEKRPPVSLPAYPWNRESFWLVSIESRATRQGDRPHPLLKPNSKSSDPAWDMEADPVKYPWLKDHKIRNQIVFPATAYLEMSLAAASQLFHETPVVLEEIDFSNMMVLEKDGPPSTVQLVYNSNNSGFRIFSRPFNDSTWTLHVKGNIARMTGSTVPERIIPDLLKKQYSFKKSREEIYRTFNKKGLGYGPFFQGIEHLWCGNKVALGKVVSHEQIMPDMEHYFFHPTLFDSCLQVLLGAVNETLEAEWQNLFLPVQIEKIVFFSRPRKSVWCRSRIVRLTPKTIEGDITVYDDQGLPILAMQGLQCKSIAGVSRPSWENPEKWIYKMNWRHDPGFGNHLNGGYGLGSVLSLETVAKQVEVMENSLSSRLGWYTQYRKLESTFDRLSSLYLLDAFHKLGFPVNSKEYFSIPSIMEKTRIVGEHKKALEYLLEKLVTNGFVHKKEEDFCFTKRFHKDDLKKTLHAILQEFPAYYAEISLTRRFGSSIPDLLKGDAHALGLMFPGGSTDLMENIYQDSPSFQLYNRMLAEALSLIISKLPPDRTLRILEIGAGTGGLTTYVLPVLPPDRTKYYFTDVTNVFLLKAEHKTADFPFVEFRMLDIEKDPVEQDFKPHSFDFILASDVLHATRDIRNSLNHIKQLLAPEGMLLLLEANPIHNSWSDLVFSFTEGWWKFTDHDLRGSYPLLSGKKWKEILLDNGFSNVITIPGADAEHMSYHNILMARGPLPDPVSLEHSQPVNMSGPVIIPGNWLVFSDNAVGDRLAPGLENCILVCQGQAYKKLDENRYEIMPGSGRDMKRLFDTLFKTTGVPDAGIVFLWGLEPEVTDPIHATSLKEAEKKGCLSLFYMARTLTRMDISLSHLYIVTRGAQGVGQSNVPIDLRHAPIWGLGRVLINEMSHVPCKLIDLDPLSSDKDVDILTGELTGAYAEQEVAFRNHRRFYPRVENVDLQDEPEPDAPFSLSISKHGIIDELHFAQIDPVRPGRDQIVIKVMAAGFNFRDVMKAFGIYPTDGDDYMLLGDECAGIITDLGDRVNGFEIGEEVIAIAPGCFGSLAVTIPEFTIKKVEGMTFEEAVTLPISFITAHYCLFDVACLKPGETVLIHAAAGGVGLAAVQIAQSIGAKVFATASEGKRDLLNGFGIEHIMDSRTLVFADQIMEFTKGKGVDVVLNSLSGEAINKGISILSGGGRFVEIGKRDIYENTKINLRPFKDNLSFHAVDLSRIMKEKPRFIKEILNTLHEKFTQKIYHPLPHRVFPAGRIVDAFRHMARAKHVGKIVASFYDTHIKVKRLKKQAPRFPSDATYLITGGMGGFSLSIAGWLVENGVRNLVLVGRSGVPNDKAAAVIGKLEKTCARIMIQKADVTKKSQIVDILRMITEQMPPLKGIIHGAMVLDDCPLSEMTGSQFTRVMDPKVEGAWNIHELTQDYPLDFFIMLSSVASLVGNSGQANYVAANTFLDTLAHFRRNMGLPGISINWGSISQVGYVAEHADVAEYFHKVGLNGISPKQAMDILGSVIRIKPVQVGVAHINWQKMMRNIGMSDRAVMRTSGLMDQNLTVGQQSGEESNIREMLDQAKADEKAEILNNYINEQLLHILGVPISKIDPDQSLAELGLDSLMAVELKIVMESDLLINLPMFELMKGPSVARLMKIITRQILRESSDIKRMQKQDDNAFNNRMIRLKGNGNRSPLFCIHGAGGDINVFKQLANIMTEDQPVFGIPSRALVSEENEHETVRDLVNEYVGLIRGYQSHTPVSLLGFSFGGLLVLNLASRLEHLGDEIAFVGLVDPDIPVNIEPGDRRVLFSNLINSMVTTLSARSDDFTVSPEILHSEKFNNLLNNLFEASSKERVLLLFEWIKENQMVSSKIPEQDIKKFLFLISKHSDMRATMELNSIRSDLYVWEAKKKLSGKDAIETDWSLFTSGNCYRQFMDTDHFNILYPPNVNEIADQIEKRLGMMLRTI